MLGLAEYGVLSQELLRLGKEAEQRIAESLDDDMSKQQAIKVTKNIALQYYDNDYLELLNNGLIEIGTNAHDFYSSHSDVDVPKAAIKSIIDNAFTEEYFGATLAKRILVNRKRLERNITRSAQVGTDALKSVITDPIPFGSQYNIDKRVLLATAVKIEQDMAKEFAKKEELPLIRWRLSSFHKKPDVCDDLATNTDKKVVSYLKANKIDEDPKGLYFADKLPLPPHPNCQCEYGLVSKGAPGTKGAVKRTVSTIRKLLKRFKGK